MSRLPSTPISQAITLLREAKKCVRYCELMNDDPDMLILRRKIDLFIAENTRKLFSDKGKQPHEQHPNTKP